ncbi:MAG: alpha/beta fold hydrolase, partial [Kiloniellales bacterium]
MTETSGRAPDGTFCRVEGPPGAPPVLLLHGVGLDLGMWDALAPALAARWRVLRYDLLGHGRSADPPGARCLDDFLAQLDSLLDHQGFDQAALVGFSMGGIVARAYAASRPQRVSRLVVMNSVFERSAAEREAVAARCAAVAQGGPAANLEAALARWFTPAFAAAQPAVVARVREVVAANGLGYLKAYRV